MNRVRSALGCSVKSILLLVLAVALTTCSAHHSTVVQSREHSHRSSAGTSDRQKSQKRSLFLGSTPEFPWWKLENFRGNPIVRPGLREQHKLFDPQFSSSENYAVGV